jgi:hypothetical protein
MLILVRIIIEKTGLSDSILIRFRLDNMISLINLLNNFIIFRAII